MLLGLNITEIQLIQIIISLIPPLMILEFFNHYLSEHKADLRERFHAILITLILIIIGIELEDAVLLRLNNRISWRVLGLPLYTWYMMLSVAIIEETLKMVAIAILMRKNTHKNIYYSIGIGCLFAGMENAWLVTIYPTVDRAISVSQARYTDGAPFIHISLAIYTYLAVKFFTWEKIKPYRKYRFIVYILLYIGAIMIHTYFNYYVLLALFSVADNNLPALISYGMLLSSLLLWSMLDHVLNNRDKDKIIKMTKYDDDIASHFMSE